MNVLDRIDNYFYEKTSKKEFQYTIFLIILAVGFVIYYYIFPIADRYRTENKKRYDNLVLSVRNTQANINVLKVQKIRAQKEIKNLNKKLVDLRKKEMFLNELTNLMDFAEFNKAKWAMLVKNIITDAKNDGLSVKLVENKIFDSNESNSLIDKKMSVGVSLKGNYINFIHFIYQYENLKDLIRVENIDINGSNNYFVKFMVYGYGK